MTILIATILYISSNNTIASQRVEKTILHWVRMPVFSLGIVLSTMLLFSQGSATAKEFYKRHHRWTEGLISAAKAVGWGAKVLV